MFFDWVFLWYKGNFIEYLNILLMHQYGKSFAFVKFGICRHFTESVSMPLTQMNVPLKSPFVKGDFQAVY